MADSDATLDADDAVDPATVDLDSLTDEEIFVLYEQELGDDCGILDVDEGMERTARRASALISLRCIPRFGVPVVHMGGEPIGSFSQVREAMLDWEARASERKPRG